MHTYPINTVYNLIVLDESGSMEPVKVPTVTGFSEIVQTIHGMARRGYLPEPTGTRSDSNRKQLARLPQQGDNEPDSVSCF